MLVLGWLLVIDEHVLWCGFRLRVDLLGLCCWLGDRVYVGWVCWVGWFSLLVWVFCLMVYYLIDDLVGRFALLGLSDWRLVCWYCFMVCFVWFGLALVSACYFMSWGVLQLLGLGWFILFGWCWFLEFC